MLIYRSYRWRKLLIDSRNLLDIDRAGAELSPVVSAVGTRSHSSALMTTWHHRASDQLNDGLVGGYAAHELRGCGFITA